MKRLLTLTFVAVFAGSLLAACGDSGQKCGPGTVKQGGDCVPACADGQYWDSAEGACMDAPTCGTGTTFNPTSGNCEPDINSCAAGTHLNEDTGECEPDIADCGPGTTFNETTGRCEPECGDDQYWTGTECAPVPQCADGTTFNPATGECEADITDCAPGTHPENGVCMPDVECGPGTHPEGGECVADYLPDPDVPDNEQVLPEFTLPEVGEENAISLGGTVGEPTDLDDDGIADPDFDQFMFQTDTGGVYLSLWATSEGATLPAFSIVGIDPDTFGEDPAAWEVFYFRYGVEPNDLDVNRELYLPRAGVYIIEITDYNHMVNQLFGYDYIPVGGDDFTYYMEIEVLPPPTPTAVDSLPATNSGDLADGSLHFYTLSGLTAGEPISLTSAGLPLVDTPSDVFPALMVFGPDGSFMMDAIAYNPAADAATLMIGGSGEYLIVQDFLLNIGPNRDFRVDMAVETPVDCDTEDCVNGDLEEGEADIYRFDLLADDYLLYAVVEDGTDVNVSIIDIDNHPLASGVADYWNGPFTFTEYVPADTSIFVHISSVDGSAGNYIQHYIPTHSVLAAGANTDLEVHDLLPVWYPAGVDQFDGTAGHLAVFTGYTFTTAPSTYYPLIQDLDDNLIVALTADGSDLVRPIMAPVPADGRYIHWIHASSETFYPNTYGLTMGMVSITDSVGTPTVDTPVTATTDGVDENTFTTAFYFTAEANEGFKIVAAPSSGMTVSPQINVLASLDPEGVPDPAGPGAFQLATASGDPADTGFFTAPYDGDLLVVINDTSGTAAGGETFDIEIHKAFCAPGSTQCAGDTFQVCEDGTAWVDVETCSGDTTCVAGAGCVLEITADGGWVEGEIVSGQQSSWFSFTGTAGSTYYVWWDDSYSGSGSYSLDLMVSAYQEDLSTPYFQGIDSGYSSSQPVTIVAGEQAVYIGAMPYFSGDTGTFAVAVTTADTQP